MVEFDYKRKVQFGERVCDMPPVGQGGEDSAGGEAGSAWKRRGRRADFAVNLMGYKKTSSSN